MKLELILVGGHRLIIDDACEHDLSMIRDVMSRYHRRWLLKRKQHVIDFRGNGSNTIVATKEIVSARIL